MCAAGAVMALSYDGSRMRTATVVGAGVFGAWTARALQQRGWKVSLIDMHGPGNSRSSSGGETRIIRSGYGAATIYARWARDSLADWLSLEVETGESVFRRTGALFLGTNEPWLAATAGTLAAEQIPHERLDAATLRSRFPQLVFDSGAVYEPGAGVLFARRAVQALVRQVIAGGGAIVHRLVDSLREIRETRADALVFACGAWLPALFPELLGEMIRPTRQEVFFFGAPPGDPQFGVGQLPAWVAFDEGIYGLPDLEHRGVKVALDAHGPAVDPELMDRMVDAESLQRVGHVLAQRLPALAGAPLLEARVCQYENTPDGHFLLDRLPGADHVWMAGGGSGHGFKHGPAIGRYMADLIEGLRTPDPLFALEGRPARRRAVF